jgi:hypothetical protein
MEQMMEQMMELLLTETKSGHWVMKAEVKHE